MQYKYILSCDWGTSSLRLQLIDATSVQSVAKTVSNQGNAAIFKQWKDQMNEDRIQFYLKQLQPLLNELSHATPATLDNLPILISGMASSSVGVKELPYAGVPFHLDGSSAIAEWISAKLVINNPVLLISGVQQSDDVMRGEETQLLGIASLFDTITKDAVYILPGTHSKHILVNDNAIMSFRTFMTGELFDILIKHSILGHAVVKPSSQKISADDQRSFQQGVNKAIDSGLLNSLFSVRINQLKNLLLPESNYYYLSGLLIGSELKHLVDDNQNLVLCSSGSLLQLYRAALEVAGLSQRTTVVPEQMLDNAAAAGQLKILNNIKSNYTHG